MLASARRSLNRIDVYCDPLSVWCPGPHPQRLELRKCWWGGRGSNPQPTDYQSVPPGFVDNGDFGLLTDNVDNPFGRNVFSVGWLWRMVGADGLCGLCADWEYHFPTAVV
jgi:hypothetical protein